MRSNIIDFKNQYINTLPIDTQMAKERLLNSSLFKKNDQKNWSHYVKQSYEMHSLYIKHIEDCNYIYISENAGMGGNSELRAFVYLQEKNKNESIMTIKFRFGILSNIVVKLSFILPLIISCITFSINNFIAYILLGATVFLLLMNITCVYFEKRIVRIIDKALNNES